MTSNSEISSKNSNDYFLMPKPVIPRIIPKYLTINSFQYAFSERHPDNQLLFKCKVENCNGTLSVDKTELENFAMSPNENPNITYILTQEHTCQITNSMSVTEGIETMQENINEIQEEKKISIDKDILERAKKYILSNKDKPIRWHMKNLLELNLVIPYEILSEILKEEREKKYPYDNQFLFNMDNIFINLDNSDINLKKMIFCQRLKKIINPKKDYREEKFYIFSSLYQIQHFIESDKIFIDLNYKICPKTFLQLMTVLAYNDKNKKFLPCFFIPMSHSSFILYDYVFKTILDLIDDYELNNDNKNKNILLQTDIESNLIKAFKINFGNTKAFGNYFNYIKKIFKKAKKCGLYKKEIIGYTKNILFGLMFIVFIKKENFINFFSEIKEYAKDIPRKMKPYFDVFIKYYEDKILNSNFINFSKISNTTEWNLKVNNVIEIYNNKMSHSLEHFFPKMAFLARKMKDILRYYYSNKLYNSEANTAINDNNNTYDIYNDMHQLIKDYLTKNKKFPCFKEILNIDGEFKKRFEVIFMKCLKCFLGFQCKTFNLNIDDDFDFNNNEYNYSEIDLIIPSIIIKEQDEDEEIKSRNKPVKEMNNKMEIESSSNNEAISNEDIMTNIENKSEENNKNININNKTEDSRDKKGKCIDDYLDYEYNEKNKELKDINKDTFENIIEKLIRSIYL